MQRSGRTRYGHVFSPGKPNSTFDEITGLGGPYDRAPPPAQAEDLMGGPDRLHQVLKGSGRLRLRCPGCGHEGEMAGKAALEAFGELATPAAVRRRLRCSKCGSKHCEVKV